MTPRRTQDDETPVDGVGDTEARDALEDSTSEAPEAEATAPKKKKAAPRKKKAPARKRATRKKTPATKAEGVDVLPPAGDTELSRPAPTEIPIKKEESASPTSGEDRVMPVGMTIEPGGGAIPVEEDRSAEQPWTPPRKADADLTVPPSILMQKRPPVHHDVVDILEPPGEDDAAVSHDFARPPVRTGLYRKIGIVFGVLAVVAMLGVGYVLFAKAAVIIHPRKVMVTTESVLEVSETPTEEGGEIPGEVEEITVAGEKSAAPVAAEGAESSEEQLVDAVAEGTVTLYNETDSPVTLIPTTRLLTPDDILFRTRSRVTIPAGGSVTAEVYADKAGASGNIGPTSFIIPGLPTELQDDVYAKSDSPMTGGVVTASGGEVAGAAATQEQIDAIETALKDELVAQAKEQLAGEIEGTWSGSEHLIETMTRFVNVAPGQSTERIVVRLTLRVRYVGFDKALAVGLVAQDLERELTSDRVLIGVDGDAVGVTIESADPNTGSADIRVAVEGSSTISLESSLFDADRLKGLNLDAVQSYFDGIEGVDRVDVRFRPFFIKRMPPLADNITFEIAEE